MARFSIADLESSVRRTDLPCMTTVARMPVLFVGHGSPMNAIEDNPWRRQWQRLGERLPRPRAVLCISAHWQTQGVTITAAARPPTIHDFYGFPPSLAAFEYPAPGDPALAGEIARQAGDTDTVIQLDPNRGLDHGAWSVLSAMYPRADVPIVQVSLATGQAGAWHYAFARRLAYLRDHGVLVLASGNIVHNLMLLGRHAGTAAPAWVARFRDLVVARVAARDDAALCNWPPLSADAALAVPTSEHYLPLLYALALRRDDDAAEVFNDDLMATIAMTSWMFHARV